MASEVRLEPPRPTLLRGSVLHRLSDGAPVGTVLVVKLSQMPIFSRAPRVALYLRIQVTPPTAHALLVRASFDVLRDARPL